MQIGVSLWKILKFAKYLVIPVLFFLYISFADALVSSAPVFFQQGYGGGAGGIEVIGLGFAATVSVTRPYFFGLVRLPVYAGDVGDISGIHDTFFAILGIAAVAFVVWDLRFLLKRQTSYTYGSKYQWRGN